jgi:ATP-dependent DNA helicase DinG
MRERQKSVLLEFEAAIKSGYKQIFFEAPTGFGKSPVAVAMALYLGSSHICTATKDLQTQYIRDFPFISDVRGRGNFPCIVKEEMGLDESCDYGPCVRDDSYDCSYKTRLADYIVLGARTKDELISIDKKAERYYSGELAKKSRLVHSEWRPCHYFDQKWKGVRAGHTVYNYRYFLSDVFYAGSNQKRNLLVLDEAHQIESEIGDFRSFTINRNYLRLLKMQMPGSKLEEIETWIDFCKELRESLSEFTEMASRILERSNQKVQPEPFSERNLIDAVEREKNVEGLLIDLQSNKNNWIVSGMQRLPDSNELTRVTLTPLDISTYFPTLLEKCSVALFMSATILSKDYLCKATGLKPDNVKFVRVSESDFPVINRPIYDMRVAWLNAKTMSENLPKVIQSIDWIMTKHGDQKGIIHTTSYSQVQAITAGLSAKNATRLIQTGSNLDRNEVLNKHFTSAKPTVLISPSLQLGVDLKDDLSRFQIIVKVPYPDLGDRKIAAMKARDPKWYTWVTVLKLVQSYGRSVRSKEDHAFTYLLDSSFEYLKKNAGEMFPAWFMEAITQPSAQHT